MKRFSLFTALVMAVAMSATAFSQVPGQISYQGMVSIPDATIDITFRLYGAQSGGVLLWSEDHSDVRTDKAGVFSIVLGEETPFSSLSFDRPYWLEIAIDGDVLSPRTKLTTNPYAYYSIKSGGVAAGSITPENLDATGPNPVNGQVLAFDAASESFVWVSAGSGGGGGISQLIEGDGIRIDGLSGPSSTIGIASGGVTGAMLATGAVNSDIIKDGAIEGVDIKDGTLTQEKFAPNVGLPNVGTAGGDLIGNYPNPQLADEVVEASNLATGAVTTVKIADESITSGKLVAGAVNSEHVNSLAELDITSVRTADSALLAEARVFGTTRMDGNVGIGTAASGATHKLTIQGSGNTGASSSLDITDNAGGGIFRVRDDGTVGIRTNAPRAALEINGGAGSALHVSSGSTLFSFISVTAGGVIAIPPNTSVVQITPDGAPGSPNTLTLPAAVGNGELLIIINNDNDPTAGGAVIAPGQSGIFVQLPAPAGWQRIN